MIKLNFLNQSWDRLSPYWQAVLLEKRELIESIDAALTEKLSAGEVIFPPRAQIFRALEFIDHIETIQCVILGQDPYHQKGQADGLAFSVPENTKAPPSLRNILKEYAEDLKISHKILPSLLPWAKQNILLLNSTLSVKENKAGSHQNIGWEELSDFLIQKISQHNAACVFILWGAFAHKKEMLIDKARHFILKAAHPSPLSAYRGFFSSRPFTQSNAWLISKNLKIIDWSLNNLE